MDCKQCRENISAYIDGELDGVTMLELYQHLSQCPLCRKEHEVILKLRGRCAAVEDVELPSDFCERVMSSLRKEVSVNTMKKIKWKVSRRVASGIAAAVVLVVGAALFMSGLGIGKGTSKGDMAGVAAEQPAPPVYDSDQASDYGSSWSREGSYQSDGSARSGMAPDAAWAGNSFGGTRDEAEMAESAPTKAGGGGNISAELGAAQREELASRVGDVQALAEAPAAAERKIIRSAYLSMETTEFERTVDEIIGKVNVYLGYIESSEIQGNPIYQRQAPHRKAHFEIRVPSKSFDLFIGDMTELGNVTSRQIRGEDITGQYLDVEARLKSLKLQEERLLTLLSKAEKLQDIIELERELSNVRYEIENYTGTLKQWDNMVQYSRVSVDVYEVRELTKEEPEPITWGDRIISGFIKSWESIGKLFADLVVFLVSVVPYLVVLGAVIWLVWSIALRPIIASRLKADKKIENGEDGRNEK